MERVATRRMIDAAASLGAADRALLNLWVNRKLDDTAVARMTGMEPSAVAERRDRIVTRLSAELGLPPEDIAQSLDSLTASEDQGAGLGTDTVPPDAEARIEPAGEPVGEPVEASVNGHGPTSEGVIATAEGPAVETAVTSSEGSGRRRWAWLSLLLAAAVVLVVVLIATSGSSPRRRPVAATHTQTVPPAPVTPTSPSPSPTVSRPPVNPLAPLPGGAPKAHGSLVLSGRPNHFKLRLTVIGLPPVHGGHYEVWLYNTVIESQPVARLRNGVKHLVVRLPHRPARFHWIDISFQPAGSVYHSGESILRAPNPARTSPRKLRRRSARRRQLRRATSGSRSAIKSK